MGYGVGIMEGVNVKVVVAVGVIDGVKVNVEVDVTVKVDEGVLVIVKVGVLLGVFVHIVAVSVASRCHCAVPVCTDRSAKNASILAVMLAVGVKAVVGVRVQLVAVRVVPIISVAVPAILVARTAAEACASREAMIFTISGVFVSLGVREGAKD